MKYMVFRDSENSVVKTQGTPKDNEATKIQLGKF